jgi:hypothetical protein
VTEFTSSVNIKFHIYLLSVFFCLFLFSAINCWGKYIFDHISGGFQDIKYQEMSENSYFVDLFLVWIVIALNLFIKGIASKDRLQKWLTMQWDFWLIFSRKINSRRSRVKTLTIKHKILCGTLEKFGSYSKYISFELIFETPVEFFLLLYVNI